MPRVMINPSCQYQNIISDGNGEEIYNEAHVMYDIALEVKKELERDGRIEAFMSRSSRDEKVTLRSETDLTRKLNCSALVALHSDATNDPNDPGGGTWSFYADDEGKKLAEYIQTALLGAIRQFHPEVNFRGVSEHWKRLWVLHESGCPASLTEILFHSHPQEREMLKDPVRQKIMAKAIAKGILEYFGLEADTL